MKKLLLLIALSAMTMNTLADVRDEFKADPRISANNYRAYPDQNLPVLTPAPEGYTPFFIDHYGRHGSRWLIATDSYSFPVRELEKGETYGKLTPRGKEVLAIMRELEKASTNRLGELSDIGAEQHQGIARRMYQNFPEVFAGKAHVDARSTVVIRCILSMLNETDMLKSLNPDLNITTDASEHDMHYMNFTDSLVGPLRKNANHLVKDFRAKHINPENFLSRLYTDPQFATDSIEGLALMIEMFDIAGNMQSHHQFEHVNLYDLFSDNDIYEMWNYNNARWYILSSETPLTRGRVDYAQANLLNNFIDAADAAIASGTNSATLRFGHESVLLPLVCLTGLNGMDYKTTDLETVADNWQCYKVFPMAGNVQWVFYSKPSSNDILVKFLLNEHEASLGNNVATDRFPYYHWTDVRAYLKDKLARIPQMTVAEVKAEKTE